MGEYFLNKIRIILLIILLYPIYTIYSETLSTVNDNKKAIQFKWKLQKDDVLELNEFHNVLFRIKNSEIYRQDKNRISLVATSCDENSCQFKGYFDTYVRFGTGNQPFRKEKSFYSQFEIERNGIYKVPNEYTVPNLRSVPAFPEHPIQVGDSWKLPAEESFDFGSGRFKVGVEAEYNWIGISEWRWNQYSGRGEKIHYHYPIFYQAKNIPASSSVPYKVFGICRGVVYFDPDLGVPQFKENKLTYTFVYSDGRVTEANFHIYGIYQVRQSLSDLAKDRLTDTIREELGFGWNEGKPQSMPVDTSQMNPLDVRRTEEGVSISMDSVLFDIDKYTLKPEALVQLEKIAQVLKKFPKREIRISGHTDSTGGKDYNQRLSELRAKTVLEALVNQFGMDEKLLSYQGFGDTKPIASNATEEGRKKNRRVDITIVVE